MNPLTNSDRFYETPVLNTFGIYAYKKVLVISEQLGGLGDVVCGLRCLEHLHSQLKIPHENLYFSTNASPEDVNLLNRKNFKVLTYTECSELAINLQIVIPCPELKLHPTAPAILISEYGDLPRTVGTDHPSLQSSALGFDQKENQIGILIDEELATKSFSLLENPVREEIPEKFQAFLKSYERENFPKIYLGYSSDPSSAKAFTLAISQLNQDHEGDLLTVLALKMNLSFLDADFKKHLSAYFGTCKFIYEEKEHMVPLNPLLTKTLILYLGRITQKEMRQLLLVSEKESLTTGDQSVSLCISANKSFVYEETHGKKKFAQSLKSLAHDYDLGSITFLKNQSLNPVSIHKFFLYNKKDNYKKMRAFNFHVCKNLNYLPRLLELLKKAFAEPPSMDLRCIVKELPNCIPLNMWVTLTLNDLIAIKIDPQSGFSPLAEYQDSIFEYYQGRCNHQPIYKVRRLKKMIENQDIKKD